MSTREENTVQKRVETDALDDATMALERGRIWKRAVEQHGPDSFQAKLAAAKMDTAAKSLQFQIVWARHGLNTPDEWNYFRSRNPEFAECLDNLARVGGMIQKITKTRRPSPSWAWLDELEQAVSALRGVIDVSSFDKELWMTPRECVMLAEHRGKNLSEPTISKRISDNNKDLVFKQVGVNSFIEPTSFFKWLKTYNPTRRRAKK